MHILYIHQYFTTPSAGGGTRSYEFAKRFIAAGHQVTMVTGTDTEKLPGDSKIAGLRIISTRTRYANVMTPFQRKIQFLRFALLSCFKKVGPVDVILATSTPLTVGIPGLWFKFIKQRPLVFEVRDLWPEAPIQIGIIRNPVAIKGLRSFEKIIYRLSDHIVPLSEGMAKGVVSAGVDRSKITVIPNASDLDLFKRGPIDWSFLKKHNLPLRPTVCYAGSLGELNEIPLLIGAARILEKRGSTAQILVAGEGKGRADLERAVSSNRNGNLIYLGSISKHEVANAYLASAAGIMLMKPLPVLQTNSLNKFFDLLAAGRPMISDMRGWIGDLIERHRLGYLVENSAESIADGIESAIANTDFNGMADRAESLARNSFDRNLLADRYLSLLTNLHSK